MQLYASKRQLLIDYLEAGSSFGCVLAFFLTSLFDEALFCLEEELRYICNLTMNVVLSLREEKRNLV